MLDLDFNLEQYEKSYIIDYGTPYYCWHQQLRGEAEQGRAADRENAEVFG